MKLRIIAFCAGLAATGMVMASCSETEVVPDVRQDILNSWSETVIGPGFRGFADSAETLARSAVAACPNLTEDGLSDVRAKWHAMRQQWKYLEPFYFGPHRSPPGRIGQTLDFWPVRENKIIELLAGDFELTGENMQRQGAIVRGIPVLEYLLYAGEPDTVSLFTDDPRRCLMMVAVAEDLHYLTERLRDAWLNPEEGYINTLLTPETGEFMDPRGALGEIVNRMGFAIENIRRDRLGAPLGDKSGGSLQPDSVESRYSGRSIPDILDVLTALDRLVHGTGTEGEMSLADHPVLQSRRDIIDRFDAAMARSRNALNAIPMPLREHLTETELVRAAFDALLDVQRSIQGDFMNVLGLTLAFNDADGD